METFEQFGSKNRKSCTMTIVIAWGPSAMPYKSPYGQKEHNKDLSVVSLCVTGGNMVDCIYKITLPKEILRPFFPSIVCALCTLISKDQCIYFSVYQYS